MLSIRQYETRRLRLLSAAAAALPSGAGGGGIVSWREARQHLVAHRDVVQRGRDRDRRLLHVLLDDALVGVEVRVPRVAVVFDRILAEADARQAGRIERRAVRAARRRGSLVAVAP